MLRRLCLMAIYGWCALLWGAETVDHPFTGVTLITRQENSPRKVTMHIVRIDLTARGIRFELTPPRGSLETTRQTTLDFLKQEHAQIAINAHFFTPFPSTSKAADLVGFAVSDGVVYSGFEEPEQNYAIVAFAPAFNIDPDNHVSVVHYDGANPRQIREDVKLWTTMAGSAQIITDGVKSVPSYADGQHPEALLKPGGPTTFSNSDSWYERVQARSVIGFTRDGKTLILFTVDKARGSLGMKLAEIADVLIADYGVYEALNLDGGGSTTLAMENPKTHRAAIVNKSSDNPKGRLVGSNLAVFAGR